MSKLREMRDKMQGRRRDAYRDDDVPISTEDAMQIFEGDQGNFQSWSQAVQDATRMAEQETQRQQASKTAGKAAAGGAVAAQSCNAAGMTWQHFAMLAFFVAVTALVAYVWARWHARRAHAFVKFGDMSVMKVQIGTGTAFKVDNATSVEMRVS